MTTISTKSETNSTQGTPSEVTTTRSTRMFSIVFSVLSYCYFFVVFLWLCLFLMPHQVLPNYFLDTIPHTLDSAPTWDSTAAAVLLDVALLVNFAILHSVLARPRVKKWMNFSSSLQRPFFVLQTTVCLHVQMQFWRNFEGSGWNVMNCALMKGFLTLGYIFGVLFLLSATFALDHFHLFGLTQGLGIDLNKLIGLAPLNKTHSGIVTRWHYKHVAHPIMTGLFIMFWSTPNMTAPHLLLATVNSIYIVIAVLHFEEKDLSHELGPAYDKYLSSTPRFIPFMKVQGSAKTEEEQSLLLV